MERLFLLPYFEAFQSEMGFQIRIIVGVAFACVCDLIGCIKHLKEF